MRTCCNKLRILAGTCLASLVLIAFADEKEKKSGAATAKDEKQPAAKAAEGVSGFSPPPNAQRLAKDYDIWLDLPRKQLIVDGKVVLREGMLEMFACPKQTKEHESIVAVNCKAQFVHAGLLALGAEPGQPVKFDPEYKPVTGPVIDVWVLWKDEKGNHKVLAQEWIQQIKTGKAMEYSFVFGGSGFFVDETTGERHYLGDGGDLICVSNFTTATLDIPVPSSQDNSGLAFRAFTERIPPIGTPVRLVLAPKLKEKKSPPVAKESPKKVDAVKDSPK